MALMQRKDEVELLQQVQTNLAAMQINNDLLSSILTQMQERDKPAEEQTLSDDEQRQAAYALNLCTVSVSQIIDYNDIYFLEHEYQAILNNLNLERMPKDEALLSILKQLLDVITYFRIQEGEKKLLEKEYQQKMKNAIWSAVPTIGLIPSGGNPVTMVVSLASQVGIGYMNYRKEKAKIGLEQERKEWELQRSAMEQFNGLRRELFDTAWRLAEKYKFPDEYRLTERQITQFNRILMDPDDLRRYERLKYISDNFKAYPPFWYYLGNAANAVYQNRDSYGHINCEVYKDKAIEHFIKYWEIIEEQSLLREDHLVASCALEWFDLLGDSEEDRSKKLSLLTRAKKASGNAFDVLELCAMSYLKIGELEEAKELFLMLVNEDYNTKINAQLLSGIYISEVLTKNASKNGESAENQTESPIDEYKKLCLRVGEENLFPMPDTAENITSVETAYIEDLCNGLLEKYCNALTQLINRYAEKYYALCKMTGNISHDMVDFLNNMNAVIKELSPDERDFLVPLQNSLQRQRTEFQRMLLSDKRGKGSTPIVDFQVITGDAFDQLAKALYMQISNCDTMLHIAEIEAELEQFCSKNGLYSSYVPTVKAPSNPISLAIFDESFNTQQDASDKVQEYVDVIRESIKNHKLLTDDSAKKMYFYVRGEYYFNDYLKKNEKAIQKHIPLSSVIAILNDRTSKDQDIIFGMHGMILLQKKWYKGTIFYRLSSLHYMDNALKFGKTTYKNDYVQMDRLHQLTDKLAEKQGKNGAEKTDTQEDSVVSSVQKIMQSPITIRKNQKPTPSTNQYATTNDGKVVFPGIGNLNVKDKKEQKGGHYRVLGSVERGPLTIGSKCQLGNKGLYKVTSIGAKGDIEIAEDTIFTTFELEPIIGSLHVEYKVSETTTYLEAQATVTEGPIIYGSECRIDGKGLYIVEKIGDTVSYNIANTGTSMHFKLRIMCPA